MHTPDFSPTSSSDRRAVLLDRIERRTEVPLTILALCLIPILFAPHVTSVSDNTREMLDNVDYLIWGLFAIDLLVKLAIAPNRLQYVRRHWVDVGLVALPMLRPLRVLRSARALRILRAGRVVVAASKSLSGIRDLFTRHGLQWSLAVAIFIIAVAGALASIAERGNPDASIQNLPDGLWWAVTTATTVGYGDTYPISPMGRGIGVALMILGISLYGIVTANVAAFFLEQRPKAPDDPDAQPSDDAAIAKVSAAMRRMSANEREWLVRFVESSPSNDRGD
jgi:voltage-gated potassium channel